MTKTLYERWQENKDRPAWVRNNRQELEEAADPGEPIPASLADVGDWLDDYKSAMTQALDTDDGTDDGGSE